LVFACITDAGVGQSTSPRREIAPEIAAWNEKYVAALRAGGDTDDLKVLRAELDRLGETFGDDPDYLLARYGLLLEQDEGEEAERVFARVGDDALTEPYQISNRLRGIMREPDRCERLAARLGEIDAGRMRRWVHDGFAQGFVPRARVGGDADSAEALRPTLRAMAGSRSAALRACVSGLDMWDRVQRGAMEPTDAMLDSVVVDPHACMGRYLLLIAGWLHEHGEDKRATNLARRVLDAVHERAEMRAGAEGDPYLMGARARDRVLVAYAHALLAEIEPNGALGHLAHAAEFSPDRFDRRQAGAFRYEVWALGSEGEYRVVYARALERAGRSEEAARVWAWLAVEDATRERECRTEFARLWGAGSYDAEVALLRRASLPVAPELAFSMRDGTAGRLAAYRGRWVVLDFCGVWCAPCVAEFPRVQAMADELAREAGDRATLIAMSVRDEPETLRRFLDSHGYDLPVGLATPEIVEAFGIVQYPTKVLIDPDGRWFSIAAGADWEGVVRRAVFAERGVDAGG
jgi:thiol-disulfide isomerase/thioredoxin